MCMCIIERESEREYEERQGVRGETDRETTKQTEDKGSERSGMN